MAANEHRQDDKRRDSIYVIERFKSIALILPLVPAAGIATALCVKKCGNPRVWITEKLAKLSISEVLSWMYEAAY
jgi:hypothetical protein